jgi:hypothetical protein
MNNLEVLGRWLLVIGLGIAILGGILWLLSRLFPNLSQLPGTIRIQTGSITCIFPILAMIVLSILLTIILNVIIKLLNK